MKSLLPILALSLAAPAVSLAASSFAYVPELTGAYTIGVDDPTLRLIHDVDLSWEKGFPRYLTYELSGVLRDPVVLDAASHAGSSWLEKINFNGGVQVDWRPQRSPRYDGLGAGFGAAPNSDSHVEFDDLEIRTNYDPSTGRFYVGATIDVQAQCEQNMMGETCPLTRMGVQGGQVYAYARFLNYHHSFVEVTMKDPGFVFVESARVGLSDHPLGDDTPPLMMIVDHSTAVPEPASIWMLGMGLIALGWRGATGRFARR